MREGCCLFAGTTKSYLYCFANLEAVAFHLKAVLFSFSLSLSVAHTNIPKTPLSAIELNSRGGGFRWRWRRRRRRRRRLQRGSLRSKASRRSAASSSSRFRILLPPIRLRFGNTFSATRSFLTSTITSPSYSPVLRYSFAYFRFTFLLLLSLLRRNANFRMCFACIYVQE